jgi:hypothetical protein
VIGSSFAAAADGTRLHYWTAGEGALVVLVHGLSDDHTLWATRCRH